MGLIELTMYGMDLTNIHNHNNNQEEIKKIISLSHSEIAIHIEKLTVYGFDLINLFDSIGNFTSLLELDLGCNFLTDLPKSMENLKNLRKLFLQGNKFQKIPDVIFELKNLEILDMFYNSEETNETDIVMPTEKEKINFLENLALFDIESNNKSVVITL